MSDTKIDISEEDLSKINTDDILVEQDDTGFNVTVDDETETYRVLVSLGKKLKTNATEQEAFEVALTHILSSYVAK